MSFIAVATGGAALIGGVASVIAGGKAAGAQQQASDQATAVQREQNAEAQRQYDLNRADLAPYREQGYKSLAQLGAGTVDGGEFNRNFTLADFHNDPGYQFRMDQGQNALEHSAAARGGVLSGGALKAIARYGQDYGSQEYGAAYNRFDNDQTTRFNRLSSLAGTGQTATNTGIAAGNALTSQLQTGATNIQSNINAAGNARASAYAGIGNAVSGAANQVGSYFALKDLYKSTSPFDRAFAGGI